jgi:hypothetical protein
MTFIQVAGASSDCFLVEYQESDVQDHHRSVRDDFSAEEIVGILESFLANDNTWKFNNQWTTVENGGNVTDWGVISILIGIAGFVFLLVASLASRFSDDGKAFGLDRTQIRGIMLLSLAPSLVSMLFNFRSLRVTERVRIILVATAFSVLFYEWFR